MEHNRHENRPPKGESTTNTVVFAPTGDFWAIGELGATFSIKASKGLLYIHRLLQRPDAEFHSLDLLNGPGTEFIPAGVEAAESSLTVGRPGDAGEMLDVQAKREYKRQLVELRERLEDAQEVGNSERVAEIESEMDFLAREISRAVGLGGRDRRAGSAAERARLNVSRAIKAALQKISEHDQVLGEQLNQSLHTGSFCSFVSERSAQTTWQLSLDSSELPSPERALSPIKLQPSLLQIRMTVPSSSAGMRREQHFADA